jgi:hypothetical protein
LSVCIFWALFSGVIHPYFSISFAIPTIISSVCSSICITLSVYSHLTSRSIFHFCVSTCVVIFGSIFVVAVLASELNPSILENDNHVVNFCFNVSRSAFLPAISASAMPDSCI